LWADPSIESTARRWARRASLVPGLLAIAACSAECVLNVWSYERHRASGDQTGFALGMLFLIALFVPVASGLMAAGTLVAARVLRSNVSDDHVERHRVAVGMLGVAAAFFVLFAVWYFVVEILPLRKIDHHGRGIDLSGFSYDLSLLGFAALLTACALVLLPGNEPTRRRHLRWFVGLILVDVGVQVVQIMTIFGWGPEAKVMSTPSIVSAVVLVACALIATRRART